MKSSLLVLLLSIISICANADPLPKVISINCNAEDNKTSPLSVFEGNYLGHGTLGEYKVLNLWRELEVFFQKTYSASPKRLSKYINILTRIKSNLQSSTYTNTNSPVSKDELLIDAQENCSYKSVVELKNEDLSFDLSFFKLNKKNQFFIIIELVHLLDTKKYMPIGLRSLIYKILSNRFLEQPLKLQSEQLLNAGFDYLELQRAIIDIKRKIEYTSNGAIAYAFLKANEYFTTPNGNCLNSIKNQAQFFHNKLDMAYPANSCTLSIGGSVYKTKAEHYIFFAMAGHIDSIYLKPGSIIKNKLVDLIASSDNTRPSKITFSISGSEVVKQYIQFTGKVFAFGSFRKFRDYFNLGILIPDFPFVSNMTLAEDFFFSSNNQSISLTGLIQFNVLTKTLIGAQVNASGATLMVQNKQIELPGLSDIFFYPNTKLGNFTTAKRVILRDDNDEQMLFHPGDNITLNELGQVVF